jgi:hypothetical protein
MSSANIEGKDGIDVASKRAAGGRYEQNAALPRRLTHGPSRQMEADHFCEQYCTGKNLIFFLSSDPNRWMQERAGHPFSPTLMVHFTTRIS